MDKEKDRTYLIVLSLLIISIEVFGITFDQISLLGNTANVPDQSAGFLILLIWLYFVWSFYQNYGFNYKVHRNSKTYLNALDKATKKFIEEKAKSEDYDLEVHYPEPISIAEYVKDGVHVAVSELDIVGRKEMTTPFFVPNKELRWYRFRSYLVFIYQGKEFREQLFPYVLMILVILIGYLGVLDFISWYMR